VQAPFPAVTNKTLTATQVLFTSSHQHQPIRIQTWWSYAE